VGGQRTDSAVEVAERTEGEGLTDSGPDEVTRAIIATIEAAGYATSCVHHLDGRGVEYLGWIDDGSEVRAPNADLWHGRGATKYEAAVGLALAVGIDLEP